MKLNIITNPQRDQWKSLAMRPQFDTKKLESTIATIYSNVESDGDQALINLTEKFDKVRIRDLQVSQQELSLSKNNISTELKQAILTAKSNIQRFHESQQIKTEKISTSTGVECWQETRPIETVGLYIPGGTAPLFSTVLMLAVPAKIAGCKEIVLCTPPGKNGEIHPAILFSALVSGVDKIYKVGGAQAIAGMALGTQTIPKVQKIFGPGNQYVTAAKQYATSRNTAIDMPAGPSEVLVIASKTSHPEFIASDLLSQAEHGIDSQVICLSTDRVVLNQSMIALANQITQLPRKEIAKKAMENSKFILFDDKKDLLDFSNYYAPEHLIIADEEYSSYIPNILNAGSVFLGNYCPESAGDYASGTNHTLPTAGYAKMYSGVNLDAFQKKISFQHIDKQGILKLGPTIEIMAESEGLHAHKNAVSLRIKQLTKNV